MDLNRNMVQSMWLTEQQTELAIYLQPPWVYKYITHGLQDVLKELPPVLSPVLLYCDTYREARGIFIAHS